MGNGTLLLIAVLLLGGAAGYALGRRGRPALEAHVAALQARRDAEIESAADLQTTFKALSSDALRDSQRAFLDMAREVFDERQKRLSSMVDPMHASLREVEGTLQKLEAHRERAYGALQQQVRGMAEAQETLRKETANLVTALRPPHGRGRWGEIHLQRVVELAGMREHCDYVVQTAVETEDGQRSRPDLVVRLP